MTKSAKALQIAEWLTDQARESTPRLRTLALDLHGVSFWVSSGVADVEVELQRRFGAYYEITPAAETAGTLPRFRVIAVDAELPDLDIASEGTPVTIQPHPLLERYRRHGRIIEDGAVRIVRQEPSGTATVTKVDTGEIGVFQRDHLTLAKDVRRLIRDLLAASLLASGCAELHAAGVALDGQAIALAGPSDAGKTTLLFAALRTGANLLCNGRVFLRPEAAGVRALGVPEHILVRPGTLVALPELRRFFPPYLRDIAPADAWNLDQTQKISIQVRDVLAAYGAHAQREATLRVLALPDLRRTDAPAEVSASQLRSQLENLVEDRGGCSRRFWHGAVDIDWERFETARHAMIERLVSEAEAVEVHRDRPIAMLAGDLVQLAQRRTEINGG